MSNSEWNEAIGLRNATGSLLWRCAVALLLWMGALWAFHAALSAIGVTFYPRLITVGVAAVMGLITGSVISRGLSDVAGMVSPILTLLAVLFATVAIVGGDMLFANFQNVAPGHLRFTMVGATMVVALVIIVRNTLLDT